MGSASKIYADAQQALAGVVRDRMTIMCGGFGLCGIPENLILALSATGVRNLTVISNNAGVDQFGLGLLLKTRDADKFYLALNEIASNGIQIESVAPADDDVLSVYEYLIGNDEVVR